MAKRENLKQMSLVYRERQKKDNSFIIQVALQTMKQVFEESTGSPLTEAMIQQQLEVNTTTMIIENRDHPIGYYSYTILSPRRMYLSALILSPEAQKKGIGSRVATQIERKAQAQGIHTIDAHVQFANSRAIVFWLKHGYRILGSQVKGMLAIKKMLPTVTHTKGY